MVLPVKIRKLLLANKAVLNERVDPDRALRFSETLEPNLKQSQRPLLLGEILNLLSFQLVGGFDLDPHFEVLHAVAVVLKQEAEGLVDLLDFHHSDLWLSVNDMRLNGAAGVALYDPGVEELCSFLLGFKDPESVQLEDGVHALSDERLLLVRVDGAHSVSRGYRVMHYFIWLLFVLVLVAIGLEREALIPLAGAELVSLVAHYFLDQIGLFDGGFC